LQDSFIPNKKEERGGEEKGRKGERNRGREKVRGELLVFVVFCFVIGVV